MSNRTMGEQVVTLSIGTALILEETLLQDKIPGDPKAVFFNVRTLFRNFWNAYPNDNRDNVRDMVIPFKEELDTLGQMINDIGLGFYFYYPTYDSLGKILPNAVIKKDETPKSIEYSIAEDIIKRACKTNKEVNFVDVFIPPWNGDILLVSHYPVDLLNRYKFKSMKLLESHTGAIKDPKVWNSKILSPDLRYLPFNPLTLSIFGDKSNLLRAQKTRVYRQTIIQMAQADKWTPLTQKDKIVNSIKKLRDREVRDWMLKSIRSGN